MAGAGYKLFNTGDVLTAAQVNTYLQEQTVMVFATSTARTTALSGVLAEGMMSYLSDQDLIQYYNGTSWVTVNTDQTPLTTKGDLFTFSTSDARLAVGNNGETLVADSSATTGLRWSATPSASNPILNSSFDIWQRGTSFVPSTTGATSYTADRWSAYRNATGSTVSRQTVSDSTNLPNIQYAMRVQRNSGNSSTEAILVGNPFEIANSIPLAGRTVTLSFFARAGANYSAASSALAVVVLQGTGSTETNPLFSGYTGQNAPLNTTSTLTTTWQRFSHTFSFGTTMTQFMPYFQMTPVGTASTNDWFELTGVQIDIGSVALPYRRNSATLAGELAACQRYYWRWSASNGAVYSFMGTGWVYSGTVFALPVVHPVQMRIAPTSIDTSGTASHYRVLVGATQYNNTSVPSLDQANAQTSSILFTNAGTMTAGQAGGAGANNTTSAYIGFNAEL